MMDCVPALPIFLVVNPECSGIGFGEFRICCCFGEKHFLLPKSDILHAKLHRSGQLCSWERVFTDSEQKEECNDDQVTYGQRLFGRLRLVPNGRSCSDGVYWQGNLGLWGWVGILVGFVQMIEGEVELFGPIGTSGVGVAGHNGCLRHVTDRFLDLLGPNLLLSSVVSSSSPGGKGQEYLLLFSFGKFGEVWVMMELGELMEVPEPAVPAVLSRGLVHCRSAKRFPRRLEITFDSMEMLGCTIRQELVCKGNREEK
jgi:hypothetical protein